MHTPADHIYQEAHLTPMTVDRINQLTQRARALPPSGDQTHVLVEDGEDPWVISHQGSFYYCTVDRLKQKILVARFGSLKEMATSPLDYYAATSHADLVATFKRVIDKSCPPAQFWGGR